MESGQAETNKNGLSEAVNMVDEKDEADFTVTHMESTTAERSLVLDDMVKERPQTTAKIENYVDG